MPDNFTNPWDQGGRNYPNFLNEGQERWLPTSSAGNNDRTVYLKNNSKHTIYYKPEHTEEALPVPAGGSVYEPIDGLATHKYCSRVYKLPGNDKYTLTASVDEDGDVDPDYYGAGDLIAFAGGGWKGIDWLYELLRRKDKDGNPDPDKGWTALFRRAGNICHT